MNSLRALQEGFGHEQMHRFILELCDATCHLHRHKVLHRDLKPGNILAQREPGQPEAAQMSFLNNSVPSLFWRPIIADFGNSLDLGGAAQPQLPTQRFCTLQYAAPEVLLRGEPYSFPSDIWSLGVTLAEMEHFQAVVPARSESDSDLTQLLRVWKWCFAEGVSHSDNSFDVRIRRELETRMARTSVKRCLGEGGAAIGSVYGSRFASVVHRFVQLDYRNRSDALAFVARLASGHPAVALASSHSRVGSLWCRTR